MSEVSSYRVETKENFFEFVARVMLQNGDEMEFISFLLTPVAATSLLLRFQSCCCSKKEEEEDNNNTSCQNKKDQAENVNQPKKEKI